ARNAAKREFGNQAKLGQQSRETWSFLALDTFWQDIKYGTRSLWRHRLLCAIVIATLSIGIGISTGVFSLISALTMRPPVNNDRDTFINILTAYSTDPSPGLPGPATPEDLQAFSKARSMREVAGSWIVAGPIGDEDPTGVTGLMVTCNFFSVYGAEQAE